ncbi:hypothetical protein [Phyllobacterium leguminum]|uniref:Uncharacterized protein n=1 Tax=Phyllobacterium leguminum TaxID=314237 RepID=A0A318T7X3_9HYPH|nr:hypothetical protein [Phyllobacterium leguminum]PYE89588.1 hypothetical protein C7477_10396 [Phyllobacterium leguminum]
MARATWRHEFERDRDFVVFRRPLKICGEEFAPGAPFDKTIVPTRKLRQLFEGHRIVFADVEKPGALPVHDGARDVILIGSSVLASTYEIAGKTVQLGDIVAATHELSGKTVAEWNELPDDEREALLRLEFDRLLTQVPSGGPVDAVKLSPPVDIPDNWRDLTWQERRSIASKVSDFPIKNGGDADAAIELELERREGQGAE